MTGVDIIGALLLGNADTLELVPATSMKAGMLPDGIELNAILVRLVSSVERQPLRRGEVVRTIDRISVAVRAKSYAQQVEIIRRVRACCAGRFGNLVGAASVAIVTAGTGPDAIGPGNSFEQTQDFRVSYDAYAGPGDPPIIPSAAGQMTLSSSDGLALVGGNLRLDLDGLPDAH